MHKSVCAILLGLWMLILGAVPAGATGDLCEISVSPQWGKELVWGGDVTIYPVGALVPGGYQLTDGLADWFVSETDANTVDFACWILHRVRIEGTTREITREDGAVFADLEPGLYLVTQNKAASGFLPFPAFTVALREGESVVVNPQMEPDLIPRTGQRGAPILWAMLGILAIGGVFILSEGKNRNP